MLKIKAEQAVGALAERIIAAVHPSRLVVGISGGADSTLALLAACAVRQRCPQCKLQAVHCIHGLDADDPVWLEHCRRLCARLKVPLVVPRLNIVYGGGRSPEEVSRAERYRALLGELKGGVLVLGHQADDQVENFLLALKRGSGPCGLSGMRFVTRDARGIIVRPLLELHKAEIEEILSALGFETVYDISNSYLKFERNFIRLKVLPLLRSRFPGIDNAILRSAELCAREHALAERCARSVCKQAVVRGGRLDISALTLEDENLSLEVLRLWMLSRLPLPPEYRAVRTAYQFCCGSSDQQALLRLGEFQLRRYRNFLYLLRPLPLPPVQQVCLQVGERLKLGGYIYALKPSSDPQRCFVLPEGENGVLLDFALKGSLRLKPRTRPHSRELKKLMGEYEVPYWERPTKCLVKTEDGSRILALGDLFATGERTDRGLELLIGRDGESEGESEAESGVESANTNEM